MRFWYVEACASVTQSTRYSHDLNLRSYVNFSIIYVFRLPLAGTSVNIERVLGYSKKLVIYPGEALRSIPFDTAVFATEFAHCKVVCVRVEKFAAPPFGVRENVFKMCLKFLRA